MRYLHLLGFIGLWIVILSGSVLTVLCLTAQPSEPLCHDGVHDCEPDWSYESGRYVYVCGR